MKKARLLLPFTHGVRTDALEYAILMAQSRDAVLVSLSIIDEGGIKGARLEDIQQSQDFMSLVERKGLKHGVEVEQKEVYTSDAVASIQEQMQSMNCDGVLLLVEDRKGVLLQTAEVKHVIASITSQVHVIRMQPSEMEAREVGFLGRLVQMFHRGRMVPSHA